jgi:hypothetical protein
MSQFVAYGPRGGRKSRKSGRLLKWVLVPTVTAGFAAGSVWAIAGVLAMHTSIMAPAEDGTMPRVTARLTEGRLKIEPQPVMASLAPDIGAVANRLLGDISADSVNTPKSARHAHAHATTDKPKADPFKRLVEKAKLSPQKIAAAFSRAGMPVQTASAAKSDSQGKPATALVPERFGPRDPAPMVLAFADPSPKAAGGALAALSAVAPLEDELDAAAASLDQPEFSDTPADTPVPALRPADRPEPAKRVTEEPAEKPDAKPDATARTAPEKPEKPVAREDQKPALAATPRASSPRAADNPLASAGAGRPDYDKPARSGLLAFAKPNIPGEGSGGIFKNFLGRPRAGGGVAVYDISAARVYMPDGSVLEAHSGIGEMADNPKYVRNKMRGPTPPHTYNLVMREKRFHGVEAIRMLPIDGKNKFGRDGFLTHSYLLRGGRAESHGCVAFKDYSKFLNAFKRGKIRQLVVVPGTGGDPIRVAKNGRDA